MKVARIETEQFLVPHGIAQVELVRTRDVRFGTDAKQLGFDRIEIQGRIERCGEDGVK